MRVLVFTSQFHELGGAERLSLELAVQLNSVDGVKADLLGMYSEDIPGVRNKISELATSGINRVDVLGMGLHPSPWSVIIAVFRLRKFLKENSYEVIETSMLGPTVLAAWASVGLDVVHVAGIHGCYRHDSPDQTSFVKKKLWLQSVRKGTSFYGISKKVANDWVNFSRTDPVRTSVIYNSIDESYFSVRRSRQSMLAEFGIPGSHRVALYVGRLSKKKGIDTLILGLGPILYSHNLWLVLAGRPDPCDHDFLDSLKKVIETRGWQNRIIFAGFRNDIPTLMASSDVFVFPSNWEGFGLVLAEAMACGTPIVATDVDGIPEVVEGTRTKLIPPQNPVKLRDAVLHVLQMNNHEKTECARIAKQRANYFRGGRRLQEMLILFDKLVQRGKLDD